EYNETITWEKGSRYKTIKIKVNKITDLMFPFKGVTWYKGFKPDDVRVFKNHGNQTATYLVTFKRPADNPKESHYGGDGFSEEWEKGHQFFHSSLSSLPNFPVSAGTFRIEGSGKTGKINGFTATNEYPSPVRATHLEWAVSNKYIKIDRLNFDDPEVKRLPWKKGISSPTTFAAHQKVTVDIPHDSISPGDRYFIRFRIVNPKTGVMIEETVISGDPAAHAKAWKRGQAKLR
ncbi:MAG: hypothetical protein GY950_14430, partial [bacterium]|nr:hypothetical protein [bacterium]